MMGNIMSMAAGSAIGHVVGRTVMNGMEGSGDDSNAAAAVAAPGAEGQQYAAESEGACSIQLQSFNKCLEANNNNIQQCQWAFDMFKDCQTVNTSSSAAASAPPSTYY
eukprot:TRINITY_DN15493_c0_g1_i3.p2 TRINITY_DN15493_c0_g1~~TRINITY_DN15493_c0_g1_i3.p2  ORF type:complete len:108 (-),score=39.05 TRINITY_DN15493_c0_g1_i3:223-546(-)